MCRKKTFIIDDIQTASELLLTKLLKHTRKHVSFCHTESLGKSPTHCFPSAYTKPLFLNNRRIIERPNWHGSQSQTSGLGQVLPRSHDESYTILTHSGLSQIFCPGSSFGHQTTLHENTFISFIHIYIYFFLKSSQQRSRFSEAGL